MDADQTLIVVLVVFVGLWVLAFALWVLMLIIAGGLRLLAMALEQNFLGLAAYLACWVLFFPVMAVICGIIGFLNRDDPWGLDLN